MFYDLKDKKPKNSGENWVAPNATIIGDVTLEKNSSIWFNAVLRGDIENIYIGEGSNVQDGRRSPEQADWWVACSIRRGEQSRTHETALAKIRTDTHAL